MRIATLPCLPCPSFTVLAGSAVKANGDRHTLLSPVQPAYWLCWLALSLQRRRWLQTQRFAGRIVDALWPIICMCCHGQRDHACARRNTHGFPATTHPSSTSTTSVSATGRKQRKQRLPTSAGVNCCCWLQGHGRYRNSNNSPPRPHCRRCARPQQRYVEEG